VRSVGIDIGSLSIKVADVELNGRILALRDYVEIPFSLDNSLDKKIQIIDGLRRIASHYDPHHTRYVVAISQERVIVRHKIFPFKERVKIIKSLPFELEDEIPFDHEKAIFDAKVLKTQGSQSELLAVATPKKYVEEILQLLNDAGIDPEIISAEGFALANLFTPWWTPPPEEPLSVSDISIQEVEPQGSAEVYLQIGHTKTLMIVVRKNSPIEIRSLPIGGLDSVRAIQKTYEISYPEALKGLQEKGFVLTKNDGATKDQITFSNTIQRALQPLTFEVKKTILELESKYRVNVQAVYLLGGMSNLINIGPYFTQKLGVMTNPYNHLTDNLKIYANHTNELQKNSAIAIGLAIEGLKKPKAPAINFRKLEFAKFGTAGANFWKKWKSTFQYASIALLLFFVYAYMREIFSVRLSDTSNDALKTVARSPAVGLKGSVRQSQIEQFIREQKKAITDHQKLSELQGIQSPLEVINKITRTLPDRTKFPIDIREFNIRNELVSLQGELSTQDQVNLLKNSIKSISTDNQVVEQPVTITSKTGRLTFSLSFKVDRKSIK
jgi:general secretion pathway protein L